MRDNCLKRTGERLCAFFQKKQQVVYEKGPILYSNLSHISLFDRKIIIFMTSFNWKKFTHLNISPQTNREMKNTETKIMEGRWRGKKKKRKTKADPKTEWEVQEGDKE